MPQKIILTVSGGCVQCVSGLPLGVELEIRDYDIEGNGLSPEYIKVDEDGDEYQEIVLTNDD